MRKRVTQLIKNKINTKRKFLLNVACNNDIAKYTPGFVSGLEDNKSFFNFFSPV